MNLGPEYIHPTAVMADLMRRRNELHITIKTLCGFYNLPVPADLTLPPLPESSPSEPSLPDWRSAWGVDVRREPPLTYGKKTKKL
jgi:hypothetical protein